MVRAVPVLVGAVPIVRPHDRYPTTPLHGLVHLFEERGDRLLVFEVLEEVGHVDPVEMTVGQLGVHDRGNDHCRIRLVRRLGIRDLINSPGLLCRNRADELAAAGSRVQQLLWPAHQLVYMSPDLAPNGDSSVLVDVAKAIAVQALVVHSGSLTFLYSTP